MRHRGTPFRAKRELLPLANRRNRRGTFSIPYSIAKVNCSYCQKWRIAETKRRIMRLNLTELHGNNTIRAVC